MTPAKARKMLDELSLHYGQRVAPVGHYCEALDEWARVMGESGYATEAREKWGSLRMLLRKSNLAARLVYGGEKTRAEPCPVHKGHWSGCTFGDRACVEGCMSGSNVTGWLPDPHAFEAWPDDEQAARNREHFNFDPTTRCQHCGGIEGAAVHAFTTTAQRSSPGPDSDVGSAGQ